MKLLYNRTIFTSDGTSSWLNPMVYYNVDDFKKQFDDDVFFIESFSLIIDDLLMFTFDDFVDLKIYYIVNDIQYLVFKGCCKPCYFLDNFFTDVRYPDVPD